MNLDRSEANILEEPNKSVYLYKKDSLRSWYVLAILLAINTLNLIDRTLPFLLIEDIKKDIDLTDTQVGILGGVAFTLVYAIAGLPIGRLLDRYSRKLILGTAVMTWGLMTAAGGLAANFMQLATSRIGLATGEAAALPAASSMISDIFSPKRRRTALGVYLMGSSLGLIFGLTVGGQLAVLVSWRKVMFFFAIPALILAGLLFCTVREPVRDKPDEPGAKVPGAFQAARILLAIPVFRLNCIALCLTNLSFSAASSFTPAYAIRRFGLDAAEAGLAIGVVMGLSTGIGAFAGGLLGDFLNRKDARWSVWLPAICVTVAAPLSMITYTSQSLIGFFGVMAAPFFLFALCVSSTYALAQDLSGPNMRSLGMSILSFLMFGLGGSLGPVLAGAISDALSPSMGPAGLGLSLALMSVSYLVAGACWWRASQIFGRS